MSWEVVYKKAINDDGSLFFPEKLTHEVLENNKRKMGTYLYTNQYLNEIIPSELQTFKKEWFLYYKELPKNINTYVFFDPALSEADSSDPTGVVVVSVDSDAKWYIRYAKRHRVKPTELIDLIFKFNDEFSPQIIGVEEVAYQKALLYFLDEEMRRRNKLLPVKGIKPPTDRTKHHRILGALAPRFEWGKALLSQGLNDLELELLQFPRGRHDDLIDALASIEYIYSIPKKEDLGLKEPKSANDKNYEKWYIENLHKRRNEDDL